MAIFRPNLTAPIPNSPFYAPPTSYIQGSSGPLIIGSGLSIDNITGVISASGGGGGSGVTSITAGAGLSGGTITSTGTISMPNIGVANTYVYPSQITTDAKGRLTAAASGTAPVTAVTGTGPISVTAGTAPVVSIASGSTTALGAVQLYNGVNSSSTTLALTACQGKALQDQINILNSSGGLTLAGTFNAATGLLVTVTTSGSGAGFTVGNNLPAAAAGNADYFVIVTTGGTYTPPGGSSTVASQGDWFLSSGTAWEFLNVGPSYPYATDTVPGIVCLSTNALAQAGTDTLTALTPANAASAYIPKTCITNKGTLISGTAAGTPTALTVGTNGQFLVACSTAPAGICWTSVVSASTTTPGVVQLATTAETVTGTDATKAVTPSGYSAAVSCCYIAKSAITNKGTLITGTAANTPSSFSAGTDGQLLSACSACAQGLTWVSPGGTPPATPIALGTVYGKTNIGVTGPTSVTALGYNAGTGISEQGVYIGSFAGCADDTCCNTFVGFNAGCYHVNGDLNVAIGWNSMCNNQSGGSNVAVGAQTLMASGFFAGANTAIGYRALCGVLSSNNVALGFGAGSALTNASQNVIIGPNVQASSPTGSCQLAIGYASGCNWLTGDSAKHIKPGAGIRDCTDSTGTNGQVLYSTGSAIQWGNAGYTNWTSAGTIQSVGWGSTGGIAVVPGTSSRNNVSYRRMGVKDWQVNYSFTSTAGFVNVGSGAWLFTLPNSLQFDGTLPWQRIFSDVIIGQSHQWSSYLIPTSASASVSFTSGVNSSVFGAGVVPFDATRFRLFATDIGDSRLFPVSNSYYGSGSNVLAITISFEFTTP